jgi:hypothetical protein
MRSDPGEPAEQVQRGPFGGEQCPKWSGHRGQYVAAPHAVTVVRERLERNASISRDIEDGRRRRKAGDDTVGAGDQFTGTDLVRGDGGHRGHVDSGRTAEILAERRPDRALDRIRVETALGQLIHDGAIHSGSHDSISSPPLANAGSRWPCHSSRTSGKSSRQ